MLQGRERYLRSEIMLLTTTTTTTVSQIALSSPHSPASILLYCLGLKETNNAKLVFSVRQLPRYYFCKETFKAKLMQNFSIAPARLLALLTRFALFSLQGDKVRQSKETINIPDT